jgi:hypothetical protein
MVVLEFILMVVVADGEPRLIVLGVMVPVGQIIVIVICLVVQRLILVGAVEVRLIRVRLVVVQIMVVEEYRLFRVVQLIVVLLLVV